MTRPVFYIRPEELDTLAPGETFELSGPEGHHAKNVKRIAAGESVDLVDGEGRRVVCGVSDSKSAGLLLIVESEITSDSDSGVVLVQALAKGDRDILAVEMATELGVSGIIPWQAQRSIVRWKADRAAKSHGKWLKTVEAAAKQARRSRVPGVESLHTTRQVAGLLESADRMFVLHEEAVEPLISVAQQTYGDDAPRQGKVYLVVGPEGGIGADELDLLEGAGAQTVRLGSEVLRSSTAGAAALSVLNVVRGRWG
ncbi:16S rRNA (uracil(1498)-N(3))-methyltransferase [Curtobacterium sp. S6]|uniref:16S rRNA (uracil(1498)-N(3))-methyltransferase n=1 Tax=Curtobacterium sp. S6 TaxID=1479623 RepID=UPI0004ABC020|nr:16S rRNA (uracil(1498)-N(3))-methyltransferase [Curtobacterium sp. S6]